ncbi:AI-2E family transporter [Nesterenkonia muleiensis]|uniref:AI-2E family transporter n=1 Tax=Nesterenkonia muleiensis TaxID=2282648 RepID=UPI001EE3D24F|nr:AI-2E family transporter [Nesterenkonia muleiensis]
MWSDALGRAGSRAAQLLLITALLAGLIWLLLRVSVVVIALLVALILASAVYPAVKWLKTKGWSSLLATLTALLGIVILAGGVVTGVVFAVTSQWDELTASAVEGWEELQQFIMDGPLPIDMATVDAALQEAAEFVTSDAFIGGAISGISAATQVVTGVVLIVVVLFFFLKDGPKIWNFTLRWFQGRIRAKLAESGDRAVQVLGGYVRGTALIAAVDAVFIGIGLAILGVPLALPLAVIVFVGSFLPIIGATIAGTLAALVALVTNGLVVALIVVAIVVAVNQIEGNLLQPVVMGRTLSLHALVVLLALTVGTFVGGIFGAILAVPLTAVAWSVIQVWTETYQSGDDPVLGPDPLADKDRAGSKASMAERWKYQRMRYPRLLKGTRRAEEEGSSDEESEAETPEAEKR